MLTAIAPIYLIGSVYHSSHLKVDLESNHLLAGIAGIRTTGFAGDRSNPGSTYTDSFVKVDYPAYPSLTATPAQPAQTGSHSQYGAAQSHASSYGSGSHGSYAHDYGSQGKQQPAQDYSASPYQPHGQPTSYSDYSAPSQAHNASSGAPSYDAGAYGYQQPAQNAQQAQQAYQQPSVPSWQQLQTDNGQAYYYNASTGVTQWERPAGFA